MQSVMLLVIGIIFVILGMTTVISPLTIKNHLNKSNKTALTDFGMNDNNAEKWVNKYVEQRLWVHRIMGFICTLFGILAIYAVIINYLKT